MVAQKKCVIWKEVRLQILHLNIVKYTSMEKTQISRSERIKKLSNSLQKSYLPCCFELQT